MWKWYVVSRLSIWFLRLCKAHRMVADDSFNIKSGTQISEDVAAISSEKDDLFHLADYKLTNQVRERRFSYNLIKCS